MKKTAVNNSNVGTFAVTTFDFGKWTDPTQVKDNVKPKKTRIKKEVVYPIFEKCIDYVNDPFWVEKLKNASYNKFPRGFSYRDGSLIYKKGNKSQSLEIQNRNYFEAANAAIEFIRSNGCIFSTLDKEKASLNHAQKDQEFEEEEIIWSKANKRVQECLIANYVVTMKHNMSLTDSEKELLRQTINLGVSNKFFGDNNIKIIDKKINSIAGLLWDAEQRVFYVDPELKPSSSRTYSRKRDAVVCNTAEKETIPQFHSKWAKYVQSLHNKINNISTTNTVVSFPSDDDIQYADTSPDDDTTQSMSNDM